MVNAVKVVYKIAVSVAQSVNLMLIYIQLQLLTVWTKQKLH